MRLFVSAQTLNAIAVGTSLLQKKQFAQKVFGLNLSLKDKKIDFTPQTQWASLREARVMALKKPSCFEMEYWHNEVRTYLTKIS
jgi:hypothetical protein